MNDAPARARPGWRFVWSHPAHAIALGFGAGLSPVAPGTAGTLWGWVSFVLLASWLSVATLGWMVLAGVAIGWWACTVTARDLGDHDPSNVVWDEIVSFWIVLWLLLPASLAAQAVAFLLFRFFDAVKPGPVGWVDRRLHGGGFKGGLGVMADDLVAALCTLLVVAWWRFLW